VLDATPITGRAELLRFFEERQGRAEQRGRHLTLNTVVDVTGDTARARSDFFFLKYVDGRLTPRPRRPLRGRAGADRRHLAVRVPPRRGLDTRGRLTSDAA
jgi:hypothetical protein